MTDEKTISGEVAAVSDNKVDKRGNPYYGLKFVDDKGSEIWYNGNGQSPVRKGDQVELMFNERGWITDIKNERGWITDIKTLGQAPLKEQNESQSHDSDIDVLEKCYRDVTNIIGAMPTREKGESVVISLFIQRMRARRY